MKNMIMQENKTSLNRHNGGGMFYLRTQSRMEKMICEYVSEGFLEMLGYSRAEFRRMEEEGKLEELIYNEDRETCLKEIQRKAEESDESFTYCRMKGKEDCLRWVQAIGIKDEVEKDCILVYYNIKDITASPQEAVADSYGDIYETNLEHSFQVLEETSDLADAFTTILSSIGESFGLRYVTLRWIDENNGQFRLAHQWKKSDDVIDLAPVYEYTPQAMQEYLSDLSQDTVLIHYGGVKEEVKEYERPWVTETEIKSILQCPIYEKEKIIGVMSFASSRKNHKWMKKEIKTLQLVVKIISMHIMGNRTTDEIDERARDLASYDSLTGLLNFSAFKDRAAKALKENNGKRKIMLIVSDFIDFKNINDTLGIQVGDEILKKFANFINFPKQCIAATRTHADNMIAISYLDGEAEELEDFVGERGKLLELGEGRELYQNIIKELNLAFCREQQQRYPGVEFSISSGSYVFEKDDTDVTVGIDNANIARKLVKKEKTHGVMLFEPYMLEEIKKRTKVLSEFKPAMENKEFLLYLQPQMNIETGAIAGAEALVRWRKPNNQFVFPDQFIPIIEKQGGIIELDFYMLERVLEFLTKWKEKGVNLFPISVNFSRNHLFNPNFAKKVCSRVEQYGVDPGFINVEITESVFVKNYGCVSENLAYLRKNGIAVSIDDFGTGYSSLNVLTQVVVDAIKIDKTFLDGAVESYATRCVVEQIIQLAKKLKLGIVCEGVETQKQVEILKDIHCRIVQGYYYEKPIDELIFEEKYMKMV